MKPRAGNCHAATSIWQSWDCLAVRWVAWAGRCGGPGRADRALNHVCGWESCQTTQAGDKSACPDKQCVRGHKEYLNLLCVWEAVCVHTVPESIVFAVFCFSINPSDFSGYFGMVNGDLVVAIKLRLTTTTHVPTTWYRHEGIQNIAPKYWQCFKLDVVSW